MWRLHVGSHLVNGELVTESGAELVVDGTHFVNDPCPLVLLHLVYGRSKVALPSFGLDVGQSLE